MHHAATLGYTDPEQAWRFAQTYRQNNGDIEVARTSVGTPIRRTGGTGRGTRVMAPDEFEALTGRSLPPNSFAEVSSSGNITVTNLDGTVEDRLSGSEIDARLRYYEGVAPTIGDSDDIYGETIDRGAYRELLEADPVLSREFSRHPADATPTRSSASALSFPRQQNTPVSGFSGITPRAVDPFGIRD